MYAFKQQACDRGKKSVFLGGMMGGLFFEWRSPLPTEGGERN
ncbi:MAG: hypothetical protein AAGD25_10575 [Cyanobacteria bacterium P01_F01_bin.150]